MKSISDSGSNWLTLFSSGSILLSFTGTFETRRRRRRIVAGRAREGARYSMVLLEITNKTR